MKLKPYDNNQFRGETMELWLRPDNSISLSGSGWKTILVDMQDRKINSGGVMFSHHLFKHWLTYKPGEGE